MNAETVQPILSVKNLHVRYPVKKRGFFAKGYDFVKAVTDVSFHLNQGETLGIVGESGCGKSSLGRTLLGLVRASEGNIFWRGNDIAGFSDREMHPLRREIQIIFQDPLASLDPRMTVGQIIAEPLKSFESELSRDERNKRVQDMMEKVGLQQELINRYPHEFSGGQCQRIGIARAMILRPKIVICDEPVSALDVSIQAQIINLLMDLQKEMGISLLFISHDLSVVRHISNRIMVLYLGRLVELANKEDLYKDPKHPYTQALISAVPIPDPSVERHKRHIVLEGDIPSPLQPPSGCPFRTRCSKATDVCATKMPELEDASGQEHLVACYHWRD